jgi:hypothetical protein
MTNLVSRQEEQKSLSQRLREFVTPEGFVGTIVFIVALGGVAWLLKGIFDRSAELSLPILALISILLLLGALLVFTTLIHLINLSNVNSALGLPDGSVRALLALALLGLFAIMASSVLVGSPPNQVKGVLASDIDAVLKANPNEQHIFWVPEKKTAPADPQTFTATFGSATYVDDFAKQMLTLVGTLMTAVISFYFGSSTTSSATGSGTTGTPIGTGATGSSTGTGTTGSSEGSGTTGTSAGTGATETGTGATGSSTGSGAMESPSPRAPESPAGSGIAGSSTESGSTKPSTGS